ncbi:hypothetical protein VHEMI06700 [[Torrubiella] hemipterigena]|uniref:Uncharacterized protein n=1 Tax=[Torrubiella] hemipterigena TaxID=1531966 RepID=A0A0A1T1B1_9HYPO|nr:hypothetical protein VHEMI06700 [[Torrubiella] hemipterigena]
MTRDFTQAFAWLRPIDSYYERQTPPQSILGHADHNRPLDEIEHLQDQIRTLQNENEALHQLVGRHNHNVAEKIRTICLLEADRFEAIAREQSSAAARANLELRLLASEEQLQAEKAKFDELENELEDRLARINLLHVREQDRLAQLLSRSLDQLAAERFERKVYETASAAAFMLLPALSDQTSYNRLIAVTRERCTLTRLPRDSTTPSTAVRVSISRILNTKEFNTEDNIGKDTDAEPRKRKRPAGSIELRNLYIDTTEYKKEEDTRSLEEVMAGISHLDNAEEPSWRERLAALDRQSRKRYVVPEWVYYKW